MTSQSSLPIYLNIYDITSFNKLLRIFGIGIYHTGIQIFDTEFAFYPGNFDQTGITEEVPFSNQKIKFLKQIKLGETKLSFNEIEEIISELKIEYIASSYDAFEKNCNHFTNEFSKKLLNQEIPKNINRISFLSKFLKCFLSENFVYGGAKPVRHRKTDSVNIAKNQKKKKRVDETLKQNSLNYIKNRPTAQCSDVTNQSNNALSIDGQKADIYSNNQLENIKILS